MSRIHRDHLHRLLSVGGPGSQWTSSGPHGMSSMQVQQQASRGSLSDATSFVQSQIDTAARADAEGKCVAVDKDTGAIMAIVECPIEPGQGGTGTRVITTGTGKPVPVVDPAVDPFAFGAPDPDRTKKKSMTLPLVLLGGVVATKAAGYW